MKIEILNADSPDVKLNWTIREYIGGTIYKIIEGTLKEEPIIDINDLKTGDWIVVHGWEAQIESILGDTAVARSGQDLAHYLEFDKDQRHCWVGGATINLRAIKKLELSSQNKDIIK